MLKLYFLLSAFLICSFNTKSGSAKLKYTNIQGGVVQSRRYPLFYDSNLFDRFLIRGTPSDIVTLKFTDFRTEGLDENNNRTDYLWVRDGQSVFNIKPMSLFGNPPTPFLVISTTRRLKLRFVSNDNRVHYQGFRATYKFHKAQESCNASNLFGNPYLVRSCNSVANAPTSQCEVQCRENYQLLSTSVSTCVDGTFSKVNCGLIDSIVSKCEDDNLIGCPYTAEEIADYYDNNRLQQNASFNAEQAQVEEAKLEEVERSILGRAKGCPPYCSRSRSTRQYINPKKCGRMSRRNLRRNCVVCRFYSSNCSTAAFFGG